MDRPQKHLGRAREYRVRLTTWELYEIRLKAADEAAARGDAEHMWHELGLVAFRLRDGGVSNIRVYPPKVA